MDNLDRTNFVAFSNQIQSLNLEKKETIQNR